MIPLSAKIVDKRQYRDPIFFHARPKTQFRINHRNMNAHDTLNT